MKIRLIAVGTKMPAWVEEGYGEYARRLNGEITLELIEIAAGKRGKNADLARIADKEGEAMLAAIPAGDHVVALDVLGRSFGTPELAKTLESWLPQGRHVSLLVGGPEGLAPQALARATERWSLSKLTLPHPLVRVLVAEQVYRAWSLLKGHPYHR